MRSTIGQLILTGAACVALAASGLAQGSAGSGASGGGAGASGSTGTSGSTGARSGTTGTSQPGTNTGPTGVLGAPQTSGPNATLPNTTQPGTVPSTMQVTPGVLPPDPTAQGIRRPYQQPGTSGNVNLPNNPTLGTSKAGDGTSGSADGTGTQRRTGDQMSVSECKQDWDSSSGMTQAQWRSSCDRMKRSGQIGDR